jgi:broad specificity phosphatase PhoE
MKTTIVLARHGRSQAADQGIVQGKGLAVPLSDEGQAQAERLAVALAHFNFDGIYSSPALRARETAAPIRVKFPEVRYEELPELSERSKGEAEGMKKDEFDARYPEILAAWSREEDPRVPGGENFADVEARAWPVILRILEDGAGGTRLIVGHGNVFRVLIGRMLGVPMGSRSRIAQGYCAINVCVFDHEKKRWSVECLNHVP